MARAVAPLLVFVSLWFGSGSPGCAGNEQPLTEAIWIFLLTYSTPLLAYVVIRALAVHVVLRFMMKRAPGSNGADELSPEKPEPATPPASEVHFLELDSAKGLVLNDHDQDLLERALETGRRTFRIFWQSLIAFSVASALCLYAYFKVIAPPEAEGLEASPIDFASVAWTGAGVLVCALIALALLALAATVTARYPSIGRVPLFSSVSAALLLAALAIGGGKLLGMPWYLYALPPLCSAVLVLGGYVGIWRKARADGNSTLLILRVFGADRNTAFVFGPLMRSWRFLGTFFTIVDPSYIRYQFSLSSSEARWKLLRALTLIGVLVGTLTWFQFIVLEIAPPTNAALAAWDELDREQQDRLIGMVAWLILIPLAVLPVVGIVRTRFIRSGADLEGRIRRAAGRAAGLNGLFSGFPLYCYDNVWKKAVSSLLRTADVVLMDLRGFSPQRLGCEFEIGMLINHYPIQQIVFLVDRGGTRDGVYQIIRRAWTTRRTASPNQGLEAPTIKTYAPGDETSRDIPRILALLVASAKAGQSATGLVPLAEGARWHRGSERPRGRWGTLGVRVAEVLDAAVATPKYARVVIPLLLAAVVGILYVSARPLIDFFNTYSHPAIAELSDQTEPQELPNAAPRPQAPPQPITLRSTATARFSSSGGTRKGRSFSNPLEVVVDFTGGPAAEAVKFGHVKVGTAIADGGQRLEWLQVETRGFDDAEQEFVPIDRSEKDFTTKQPVHPDKGFRVKLWYFRPEKNITRVESLAGSVALQTVDPQQVVTLANIGSRLSGPGVIQLKHPMLDDVGLFSFTVRTGSRARLVVKGLHLPPIEVRLIDAFERVSTASAGSTSSGDETTKEYEYKIDRKSLQTARLEIVLGYKSFEAPFTLKNITIEK